MRTRVCRSVQSPDANEGALARSKYSMERTPDTELLFAAKERVALPRVRIEVDPPSPGSFGATRDEQERRGGAEQSSQE